MATMMIMIMMLTMRRVGQTNPEDDDSYDNGVDDADKRWFLSNLGAKRGEGECDGGGRHHPWGWT